MFLGAIWYSPLLFGDIWMKCIGKSPDTLGNLTGSMIGSIVASLLTAIGIAVLFSLIDIPDLATALLVASVIGLLIIFPALLSDNLFCGWGIKLLCIQAGYRASAVLLMSVAIYYF